MVSKIVRRLIERCLQLLAHPFDLHRLSRNISDHFLPMDLQTRHARLPRAVRARGDRRLHVAYGALLVLHDVDLSNVQKLHERDILREQVHVDDRVFRQA